jgi:hypothetical protein
VFAASSSTFVAPPLASVPSLRSVLLSEALNATLVHAQTSDVNAAITSTFVAVHAHASDVNASASSTFVAPPVSVDESLARGPVSAAGEDLKLGLRFLLGWFYVAASTWQLRGNLQHCSFIWFRAHLEPTCPICAHTRTHFRLHLGPISCLSLAYLICAKDLPQTKPIESHVTRFLRGYDVNCCVCRARIQK